MTETTKIAFTERLNECLLVVKSDYVKNGNADITGILKANHCRINGCKELYSLDWNKVVVTDDFVNHWAEKMIAQQPKPSHKPRGRRKHKELDNCLDSIRSNVQDGGLAGYSARELLLELRSRGYKWEKMTVTVTKEIVL